MTTSSSPSFIRQTTTGAAGTFSSVTINSTVSMDFFAVGKNAIVAVGSNGTIRYSLDDGKTYTLAPISDGFGTGIINLFPQHVFYGNGMFIVVGYNRNSPFETNRYYTSTDGINWVSRTFNAAVGVGRWGNGVYANGKFVVVTRTVNAPATSHRVISSTDGITWTQTILSNTGNLNTRNLVYSNGYYSFALDGSSGQGYMNFSSVDGVNWTGLTDTEATRNKIAMAAIPGGFIAIRLTAISTQREIIKSTNGLTWTVAATINVSTQVPLAIAHGSGVTLAISSSGTCYRSTNNGDSWSIVGAGFSFSPNIDYNSLLYVSG